MQKKLLRRVRGASPSPNRSALSGVSTSTPTHCGQRVGKCSAARDADHAVSSLAVPPEIGRRQIVDELDGFVVPPFFSFSCHHHQPTAVSCSANLRSLALKHIAPSSAAALGCASPCAVRAHRRVTSTASCTQTVGSPNASTSIALSSCADTAVSMSLTWRCIVLWLPPHGQCPFGSPNSSAQSDAAR